MDAYTQLMTDVRACKRCAEALPCRPRPVLQLHPSARILIAGQAPGRKVQQTGVPFDDASGDRLRDWLGLSKETFYDAQRVAILPMGFCYPGTGASGDLPPRPECAPAWRSRCLAVLKQLELTVVLGQYAQAYHFGQSKLSVTTRVKQWQETWPEQVALPHPSPRNNRWLKQNPWFETEVLPVLRQRVSDVLHD